MSGEAMELMRTRLREERENQGLTQKDLAEIIGIGKGTVMALENTSLMRAVSLDTLCDVCDALGISLDWVFGRTTNRNGFETVTTYKVPMLRKFFNQAWNAGDALVEQELRMTTPRLAGQKNNNNERETG